MKLRVKEIGFGLLAACTSTSGEEVRYADLRAQTRQEVAAVRPEPTTTDEIKAMCQARMLAVQRHFGAYNDATGGRFDSWDKAAGKELDDCLAENGLGKSQEAKSENQ